LREDDLLGLEAERFDEAATQLREEGQRSAQERDVAPDGVAAGKAGDRLVDDGLEDRHGEIFARRALIDEGLDVALGEDAAARGNGVDRCVMLRGLVEALRVGV
jgi:hypothetical protein